MLLYYYPFTNYINIKLILIINFKIIISNYYLLKQWSVYIIHTYKFNNSIIVFFIYTVLMSVDIFNLTNRAIFFFKSTTKKFKKLSRGSSCLK